MVGQKIEPWIQEAVREVASRRREIERNAGGSFNDLPDILRQSNWEREVSKILQAHFERRMGQYMLLIGEQSGDEPRW